MLLQVQQDVQQLLQPGANIRRCRTPLTQQRHGPLVGPGSLAWPQGVGQHPICPMSVPSSSPNSPSPPNSPYSWFSNPPLYVKATDHDAEEHAPWGGGGTTSCDALGQAPGGGGGTADFLQRWLKVPLPSDAALYGCGEAEGLGGAEGLVLGWAEDEGLGCAGDEGLGCAEDKGTGCAPDESTPHAFPESWGAGPLGASDICGGSSRGSSIRGSVSRMAVTLSTGEQAPDPVAPSLQLDYADLQDVLHNSVVVTALQQRLSAQRQHNS